MAPPSAEAVTPAAHDAHRWRARLRASPSALRLASALALAAPAAAAFVLGQPLLGIFIALVAAVLAWEWVRVCGGQRFGAAGAALLAAMVLAASLASLGLYNWCSAAILASAPAVALVAQAERRRQALWIGAGALYIGLPVLSVLWLYGRDAYGRPLVIWLILTVIATDVGAYVLGRMVGGPRLAPRISPGKTWSGLVGGMICAAVAGGAAAAILDLGAASGWLAAAALIALVAQAGDLFESGIKRSFGVKDASRIMPGHGGLMDRVDGLVAGVTVAALAVWLSGGDPTSWG